MIETATHSIMCLICNQVVKIVKGDNAKQHFRRQELARKTLVLFGRTRVCEAGFSRMKYLKNKYRTRLSDGNLKCGLRLMISSEPPNFSSLSEGCKIKEVIKYNFVIYD